ncbi:hypothetical protein [Massiliimalia timonensis]|uniref:hypothetical protein n=1 Tax=Massiliimalia timonensis TaxID=1987501 RepID=UPI00131A4881|nr:hypothetical protein [Massiliimalia timonensis]
MSWVEISQIAAAAIVSAGGIGGIIIGVVSFSANKIADRMDKKFQASLDKQLEKYKSDLSKKEYVSKTKFDTEFALYRELSLNFADMVKSINILIPIYANLPADKKARLEYEKKCYESACPAVVKAQDTLNSNIPFISEEIFNGYEELLRLSILQLDEYVERFNALDLRPQQEKESFSPDAYKRTREINEKWKKLNNTIRAYISNLDVMEDK